MNKEIATGKAFVLYDPLETLKALRAAMGYNDGFVIHLGKDEKASLYRLLVETIDFCCGAGDSFHSVNKKGPEGP